MSLRDKTPAARARRFSSYPSRLVVTCALVRIFFEEKLLVARYPKNGGYAATTARMIPFLC
jgi:hypothetical protein